ncbi:MAG: CHAT domain-containing protein [Actinomycetota bacterium]|nr:CHAT domain-containing protein [Actinomycetota bacterium]
MRLGRYAEALQESERALPNLRPSGLETQLAYLRSNRGLVWAYLGDFDRAETELNLALELHRRQGSELSAAQVVNNLGFVASMRGDVPAALRYFDESVEAYERLDLPCHLQDIDRCQVLMSAHLLPEAREAAEQAVQGLERAGLGADLAEGRLMLAEVALAEDDHAVARTEAGLASSAFARQRRTGWAALAHWVAARASWMADGEATRILDEAPALAVELESAGWRLQGLEARIAAARAAIKDGYVDSAAAILADRLPPTRRASADERVRAWYAEALARLAANNRAGALRALRAGLRVADEHRFAFGATELRVRAATETAELAELGLDLVLEQQSPQAVLAWAECWRARSLWRPGALPPENPELARRLSDLRHVVSGIERAGLAGEPTEALEQQRSRIEAEIRQQSLRGAGAAVRSTEMPPPPSWQELQAELDEALLVEFVSRDGELYAVSCERGSCRLHALGSSAAVAHQRAALSFALGRLAYRRSAPASLEAAAHLIGRAARAVDELLVTSIGPLADGARDPAAPTRPVVLVPTGELHAIPWGILPTLRGRPVAVAPSAALWLERRRSANCCSPGQSRCCTGQNGAHNVVVVAGPGVPTAVEEVQELNLLYPDATVLENGQAVVRAVAAALEGACLAHVAAHGRFRSDNALFSALDLHDGPLTVYDLEGISRPPPVIVLSACDAGRSQVHPGDELMGTTAALLAMGTDTIVASVAPVPDSGAPEVMARLHEQLREGADAATALARVQSDLSVLALHEEELAVGSPRALAALAASAFVCFGTGGAVASRHPCPPSTDTDAGTDAGARPDGPSQPGKITS